MYLYYCYGIYKIQDLFFQIFFQIFISLILYYNIIVPFIFLFQKHNYISFYI